MTPSTHGHYPEATLVLDLRGTPCPLNFVRTKLQLEKMNPGDRLEVWLDPGEPQEQVPDSLAMAGYDLAKSDINDGYFTLLIHV